MSGGIHTAIMGALQELPDPGPWEGRERWLLALAAIVRVLYPDPEPHAEQEAPGV